MAEKLRRRFIITGIVGSDGKITTSKLGITNARKFKLKNSGATTVITYDSKNKTIPNGNNIKMGKITGIKFSHKNTSWYASKWLAYDFIGDNSGNIYAKSSTSTFNFKKAKQNISYSHNITTVPDSSSEKILNAFNKNQDVYFYQRVKDYTGKFVYTANTKKSKAHKNNKYYFRTLLCNDAPIIVDIYFEKPSAISSVNFKPSIVVNNENVVNGQIKIKGKISGDTPLINNIVFTLTDTATSKSLTYTISGDNVSNSEYELVFNGNTTIPLDLITKTYTLKMKVNGITDTGATADPSEKDIYSILNINSITADYFNVTYKTTAPGFLVSNYSSKYYIPDVINWNTKGIGYIQFNNQVEVNIDTNFPRTNTYTSIWEESVKDENGIFGDWIESGNDKGSNKISTYILKNTNNTAITKKIRCRVEKPISGGGTEVIGTYDAGEIKLLDLSDIPRLKIDPIRISYSTEESDYIEDKASEIIGVTVTQLDGTLPYPEESEPRPMWFIKYMTGLGYLPNIITSENTLSTTPPRKLNYDAIEAFNDDIDTIDFRKKYSWDTNIEDHLLKATVGQPIWVASRIYSNSFGDEEVASQKIIQMDDIPPVVHIKSEGTAMAVGQYVSHDEVENSFECGWPAFFENDLYVKGNVIVEGKSNSSQTSSAGSTKYKIVYDDSDGASAGYFNKTNFKTDGCVNPLLIKDGSLVFLQGEVKNAKTLNFSNNALYEVFTLPDSATPEHPIHFIQQGSTNCQYKLTIGCATSSTEVSGNSVCVSQYRNTNGVYSPGTGAQFKIAASWTVNTDGYPDYYDSTEYTNSLTS